MRKLFVLLLLVVLAILAVGWYLEWYQVTGSGTAEGHQVVTIDINTPKIGDDLASAKQRVVQTVSGQSADKPATPEEGKKPEEGKNGGPARDK